MKVKIRKANLEDLKTLQEFMFLLMKGESENFEKYMHLKWAKSKKCKDYFTDRIKSRISQAIIAEVNGEPVGYLSGIVRKGDEYRVLPVISALADMFVLEEYRNKKIGTALMKEFKKFAKARKAKVMRVMAYAKNKKALKFYRRHGLEDHQLILEGKI